MRVFRKRFWAQNICWRLYLCRTYSIQNSLNKAWILQVEFIFLMKKFCNLEGWLKKDIKFAKYLLLAFPSISLAIVFGKNLIKIFGWGSLLEKDSEIDSESNKMVKLFNNIFFQKPWINFTNKLKMAQKDFR